MNKPIPSSNIEREIKEILDKSSLPIPSDIHYDPEAGETLQFLFENNYEKLQSVVKEYKLLKELKGVMEAYSVDLQKCFLKDSNQDKDE